MASITVNGIPDCTAHALRVRAAERGVSLESYVRDLLQAAIADDLRARMGIVEAARLYFGPDNGIDDLELPSRRSHRACPDFDA